MGNVRCDQTELKKNGEPRKRFYLDYTGKTYGQLEVIGEDGFRGKNKLWKCKCLVCGKEKSVVGSQLRSYTKSCGCRRTMREWTSPCWKGEGEISRMILTQIKTGAKRRNKEYNVSDKYLWELFLKQDRKCALTGLSLQFGRSSRVNITASLDRIDSSKGYIEGNVQWVHKYINAMKLDHSEKYFIELCNLVVNYNNTI